MKSEDNYMQKNQERDTAIDFSSVLAAAVHDMKNSLCLLIQSIEQLSDAIPEQATESREQVANVHYEASRLNTNLVQILSLYRSQLESLPITVDECFIGDLFSDVVASNRVYIEQKAIALNIQCQDELSWYLDADLIYLLVNDAVVNALRYGKQNISIEAFEDQDSLVIRVSDDGEGYPDRMLSQSHTELSEFNVSQGRTGLGLFFARLIAAAHTRDAECGEISLTNGGSLGGSVFEVKIP